MANGRADSSDQEENKKKKKEKEVGNTCAACKHLEKMCNEGECEFAPYFPADRMEDFKAVQKFFKISKVRKMLKEKHPVPGGEVAKSLIWEAKCWKFDPVRGPLGYHNSLCDQVRNLENQISNKDQQIQLLSDVVIMQQQQQRQRQQQPVFLPLLPSGGDGNGRMGSHQQDHHMTIQENNAGMIMPRSRHDDQDGVHRRAAAGGDHQHGRQSYQQRTEYQHHPDVFGSEHGRGSGKRSRH